MATDVSPIDVNLQPAGQVTRQHLCRSQGESISPRVRGPTHRDPDQASHPGTQSRRVHISEFAKWFPTLTLFG